MTENDGGTPRDPQQDPETPPTQPVPESFGAEPAPGGPAQPGRSEPFEQGTTEPYGQAGANAPYGQASTPYEQQSGSGYGQPAAPAVTQYGYAATPPKNDLAVWSLVTGILSYVTCPLLLGIAAIVTGVKGRRAADEGLANNRGMATAGLILGWINVALALLGVVFFVFVLGAGLLSGGISQWNDMNGY
ncbi:DUF4190 domain-containing protein [Promicromonospora iranensis]|uniref:DUF4190 domain-containing protein n=1 Tax=Promicromonospora iranensis TaxID=1105144 RepID=A0ABU2CVU1_9MICO|nr:DUF4190 domain-containing protein [Promicromonospora iranensis]MDR7385396.1 hypothetical protein [Promicromonospora iranensis]